MTDEQRKAHGYERVGWKGRPWNVICMLFAVVVIMAGLMCVGNTDSWISGLIFIGIGCVGFGAALGTVLTGSQKTS
jgi:hypothetical protein